MDQAAHWTERYAATAMVWDTKPNAAVVESCTPLPPGRALDLGAGEGRNAIWLASRGWEVTAVDFVSIAVNRISAHAALQDVELHAVVADAVGYQPATASLDLILLSYLQLPDDQFRKVLANVIPGLAPGGRVLIVAHDASNLHGGYGGPQDPTLLSTPEIVARHLRDAGLKVMRAEVIQREAPSDAGLRLAYDHVVEAQRLSA